MAIVILILVLTLMTVLVRKARVHKKQGAPRKALAAEHQRKQSEVDELITIILPTIKND